MKKLITILLFSISILFASANDYTYLSFNESMQIKNASDFILKTQGKLYTESEANDLAFTIWNETASTELEYEYVMAIIMTESRFNYKARSWCGAIGLMQIMPNTFVSIAKKNGLDYKHSDIYDIEKNIEIGIKYLDYLHQRYGKRDLISAGYNGGPGNANKWKKGQFNSIPKETKNYVKKVNEHREYFIFKLNDFDGHSDILG